MAGIHHPKIFCRGDADWLVHCPECSKVPPPDRPIGLDLPLKNKETAEALVLNHTRIGRTPKLSQN